MDGSGYPQSLSEKEIPLQAQILAIADIYDALTAGDRPYKKGLPVQSALAILHREARENKLNTELLKLFEECQVYSVLGHTLTPDDAK